MKFRKGVSITTKSSATENIHVPVDIPNRSAFHDKFIHVHFHFTSDLTRGARSKLVGMNSFFGGNLRFSWKPQFFHP